MIINFFDKFDIDTCELKEKLDIISNSNSENANYLTYIFNNALEYLFEKVELNIDELQKGFPNKLENLDFIIYFDNLISDDLTYELLEFSRKANLIVVGNHLSRRINSKVECLNINEFKKIKRIIKDSKNIVIGINVEIIDYGKYYYGRMRSYFLHIANSIKKVSIDELKENIEEKCTNIMLDENNFKIEYEPFKNSLKFKQIIDFYLKILKLNTQEKKIFYTCKRELNDKGKIMLNEFNSLIKLFNIKNSDEKTSFMYDNICEKMMKEIKKLNYCDFENNKCVTMRYKDGFPNSKENGCCSNTYMDKGKDCRYLNKDHSCKICSISCRVFTCAYLQKRGIDHALWQYPIIDCSIGKLSRPKLIHNFFIPKEIMIKKLRNSIKN